MGYTKPIETGNATYVVSLEIHPRPDYSALESGKFDFAVIEQGMARTDQQIKNIKNLQQKTNCDILLVDPEPTGLPIAKEAVKYLGGWGLFVAGATPILASQIYRSKIAKPDRRKFLKWGAASIAASHLFQPTMPMIATIPLGSKGEIRKREPLMKLSETIGKIYDPVIVDARNAIIAEKLDGALSPILKKELKRKPQILIQIGAGHAGIVEYLKKPKERRAAILKLKKKIENGLVKEQLDKSFRVRWDEKKKELRFEELKTPVTPLMRRKKLGRRDLFKKVAGAQRRKRG